MYHHCYMLYLNCFIHTRFTFFSQGLAVMGLYFVLPRDVRHRACRRVRAAVQPPKGCSKFENKWIDGYTTTRCNDKTAWKDSSPIRENDYWQNATRYDNSPPISENDWQSQIHDDDTVTLWRAHGQNILRSIWRDRRRWCLCFQSKYCYISNVHCWASCTLVKCQWMIYFHWSVTEWVACLEISANLWLA